MSTYIIRVSENLKLKGLKLSHVEELFFRYLNRKKAREPVDRHENINYELRNRLQVVTQRTNGGGEPLVMLVTGDKERIIKSIEALRRRYHPQYVKSIEFIEGYSYILKGAMETSSHGFGNITLPRTYVAKGSFSGVEGNSIKIRFCDLEVNGYSPRRAELMLFPYQGIAMAEQQF